MANDDRQQTIDEFNDSVNMTRKELEDWLRTDESKSVGQGEGESKGHESGRSIVGLLEKNKLNHPSAWNTCSPNFACRRFSEVRK